MEIRGGVSWARVVGSWVRGSNSVIVIGVIGIGVIVATITISVTISIAICSPVNSTYPLLLLTLPPHHHHPSPLTTPSHTTPFPSDTTTPPSPLPPAPSSLTSLHALVALSFAPLSPYPTLISC